MLQNLRMYGGICCISLILASCNQSPQEPNSQQLDPPASIVQGEPIETLPDEPEIALDVPKTMEAGAYCYRTEAETYQAIAELLIEPSQAVSGTLEATISNAEAAYYTSYTQNFSGVLQENQLNATTTTHIENDVQHSQETWTLTRNIFSDGNSITLKRVSCEEIITLKANRKAEDKISTPPNP